MKFDFSKAEVFDRTTEKQYKLFSAALYLDDKGSRIRINLAAINMLDLRGVNKELGLKFVRFQKAWFLCVSADNDAYNIADENKARAGATVGAAVVLGQMLKDHPGSKTFYLVETEHELKGKKLYELLPKSTNKS